FLVLLPFLSSGFVPTDSMPSGARWGAEHQPFTPWIETVRGLLMGTPIGSSGVATVVWCVVISAGGYLWARTQYDRRSVRCPPDGPKTGDECRPHRRGHGGGDRDH